MLKKILGNLNLDLFRKILFTSWSKFAIHLLQNNLLFFSFFLLENRCNFFLFLLHIWPYSIKCTITLPFRIYLNCKIICENYGFQAISSSYLSKLCRFVYSVWFFIQKTILISDVETNPGPKPKSYKNFPVCYCSLSSIATQFCDCHLSVTFTSIYLYFQLWQYLSVRNIPRLKRSIWWWQFRNFGLWLN